MFAATVVIATSSVLLAIHFSQNLNLVLEHLFTAADVSDAVPVNVVESCSADFGLMESGRFVCAFRRPRQFGLLF